MNRIDYLELTKSYIVDAAPLKKTGKGCRFFLTFGWNVFVAGLIKPYKKE